MKFIFKILYFSAIYLFSIQSIAQENIFYSKNLIDSILIDTTLLSDDKILLNDIKELVICIRNDKGLSENMFPFTEFDSVVSYRFNENIPLYLEYQNQENKNKNKPVKIFKNNELKHDLNLVNGIKLNKNQIADLLNLINNPRNFSYSFIFGSNFHVGLIIFYEKSKIKSYITIDSMLSFHCYPENKRIKYGSLIDRSIKNNPLLNILGYIIQQPE